LIAIFNAWLVDLATLPLFRRGPRGTHLTRRQVVRLWSVTILIGTTLCYGAFRLSSARFQPGPRLALLQTNLPQGQKERNVEQIYAGFKTLVNRALSDDKQPDLIVWPETSYPYNYVRVDPDVTPDELGRQLKLQGIGWTPADWLERSRIIDRELHLWTNEIKIPMLVGSAFYAHGSHRLDRYNSALLFKPLDPTILTYFKMHLVPFGEFIPLIDKIPLLAALTPYRDRIPSLSFGRDPITIALGSFRLLPTICFEDTIPQVVNRFFPPGAAEPDLIVNLTNDGWFHGSSELDMHLAISAFRCVEHRIPLARAVNGGLTAIIDGNGQALQTLAKDTTGVLAAEIPLDDRSTLYTQWGDWLGISCLAVTIGLLPMGLARGRYRIRGTPPSLS
jgi:apolipoprotein N-acyltransferase